MKNIQVINQLFNPTKAMHQLDLKIIKSYLCMIQNQVKKFGELKWFDQCMNYKREQHPFLIQLYGENSHYSMEFVAVSSLQLYSYKFKHTDIALN